MGVKTLRSYDEAAKIPQPIHAWLFWYGVKHETGTSTKYFALEGPGHRFQIKVIGMVSVSRKRLIETYRVDLVDVLAPLGFLTQQEAVRFQAAVKATVQQATGYEVNKFGMDQVDGVEWWDRVPGREMA